MNPITSAQRKGRTGKGRSSRVHVSGWKRIASLWMICLVLSGTVFAQSSEESSLAADIAASAQESEITADTVVSMEESEADADSAKSTMEGDSADEIAVSAGQDDSTVDFVLVLDNSGTMARSDPDGLTVSAAKMFVDMLPKKNARVAVVEFGSNYGEDAFSPEKYTNYVRVSFPLTDISSVDQKLACKQVISQTTQDGEYTPVGYALQAACDVLQRGGAEPGDAGILLISDFRVTGQRKEDFLEDGYSYQSLEDAERIAAENQWPVYTLEMNFDGKNDQPGDYTERIAARLRSGIPEKVGYGDYVPLHNAGEAQTSFAEIFEGYFDPNHEAESQSQTRTTDEDGIAVFPFTVEDMTAELNVTLTCPDSDGIKSLEIGHGNQMTEYDLTAYQEPIQEEYRSVTKEDRYITLKLLLPPPGEDWQMIVHGDAQTEVGMYALSIHDMEFRLDAVTAEQLIAGPDQELTGSQMPDTEADQDNTGFRMPDTEADQDNTGSRIPDTEADQDNIGPGSAETEADLENTGSDQDKTQTGASITVSVESPIHFTATYIYDGKKYASGKVYQDYPAVLEIVETGEQIPMISGEMEYVADISFLREGTYTVKAIANSDTFRTGSIETGTCSVTVVSVPVQILATQIQNQELVPGGILELNLAEYFYSTDGAPLAYYVTADPATPDLGLAMEGDLLRIMAGVVSGKSVITITADDGSQDPEKSVMQAFEVEIINRPLELIGEEEVSCPIDLGQDTAPEIRIEWADHFQDPDGFQPVIEVSEVDPDDALVMTQDETGMTLRAEKAGNAVFAVTATDADDSSISAGFQVKVTAEGSKTEESKVEESKAEESKENTVKAKTGIPILVFFVAGAALIVLLIVLLWRRFH